MASQRVRRSGWRNGALTRLASRGLSQDRRNGIPLFFPFLKVFSSSSSSCAFLSFNQATSIGNSDRSRLGIQNMAAKDPVIVPAFFTLLISFLCRAALSAKSPSYYYDQCAPSNCGDSVLQFPFGLNPLCRTAIVSSSCENGSVYLTQVGAQGKYRILDDLTSPVYDRGVFTLVDVSLLGCGPIAWSADNTDGLRWFMAGNLLVSSDYKTGTFFNCTHPPEADMMARLSKAPCLECGNSTHNNNLCYYYDGYMDKISNCTAISVALQKDLVNNFTRAGNLRTKLQEGFKIQWKSSCGTACMNASGGRCGFVDDERGEGSEMCFCASSVHKTSCSDGIIISLGGGKSQKKSLIAGLGAGFAFLMVGIICLAYGWKRNQSKKKKLELIRGQDEAALRRYLEDKKAPASIETFLENYACGNGCEGTNTSSSSTIAAAGSKWHVCDGEEDEKIARMLELVGLWCIQSSPTKRPSMRKVVHMLEGTAVIELPPIPFDASVAQFARSDN
ncbi:hypothetical protein H6P81_001807 [Aristolochia fimbriata]|uniref:Wall-associated receptor kinase galacturonan-binding domain-containing protein n=1 Tax=Aristolochia fimbriata TaxID=158543 RepID=A0AAV7F9M0_ARIFI|nr:hypothetical protein H6P81_001807 [Aristolochia fimbriata]